MPDTYYSSKLAAGQSLGGIPGMMTNLLAKHAGQTQGEYLTQTPEGQHLTQQLDYNAAHRGLLQSPLAGLGLAFAPLGVAALGGAFAGAPAAAGAGGAGAAGAVGQGIVPGAVGAAGAAGAAAKGLGTLGTIGKVAPLVLGGVNALTGAAQQGKSNDLLNEALGLARQNYAERAPLRQGAIQALTGPRPQAPDLSATFRSDNPFAHPVPAGMPGAAPAAMPGRPMSGGMAGGGMATMASALGGMAGGMPKPNVLPAAGGIADRLNQFKQHLTPTVTGAR